MATCPRPRFDGEVHAGVLIVDSQWAEAVAGTFDGLLEAGFPIKSVRPVSDYNADDDRSMADNNTSGFNCRPVGGSNRWSQHSYGLAIDINPIQNPYVHDGVVEPPAGHQFVDRSSGAAGLIVEGDAVVGVFDTIGWKWGGRWSEPDYQHFSVPGR